MKIKKKILMTLPRLVWLSGLSTGVGTKGLPVRFPVRAHAWVMGQVPSWGRKRGNHTLRFLSLFPSLHLSLKINNFFLKEKAEIRPALGGPPSRKVTGLAEDFVLSVLLRALKAQAQWPFCGNCAERGECGRPETAPSERPAGKPGPWLELGNLDFRRVPTILGGQGLTVPLPSVRTAWLMPNSCFPWGSLEVWYVQGRGCLGNRPQ